MHILVNVYIYLNEYIGICAKIYNNEQLPIHKYCISFIAPKSLDKLAVKNHTCVCVCNALRVKKSFLNIEKFYLNKLTYTHVCRYNVCDASKFERCQLVRVYLLNCRRVCLLCVHVKLELTVWGNNCIRETKDDK